MTHVVDLIQYAAQYIDVEAQKVRLQHAADASKAALEQAKVATEAKVSEAIQGAKAAAEQALEKVQPAKKLVEDRTAEIKDTAQRTTVAVVASIAHATEVVRRQIGARTANLPVSETRAELQRRLTELIDRTKAYTNSLNEAQLKEYIATVRAQSGAALASLINVINSSSSSSLRAHLSQSLLSWSNSLVTRLGYQIVPVTIQDAPFPADLIEEGAKSSDEAELEKSEKDADSAKSE